MKRKSYDWFLPAILLFCIFGIRVTVIAQENVQRDLLEKAYQTKSYDHLATFFDNWQKALTDNEAEASDKWIKEAHQVFTALLGPSISSELGIKVSDPVLVLQGSLEKIGCVKRSNQSFKSGNLNETAYTIVDSAIAFRPRFQLENLTTVYLTEDYKLLMNDFLSNSIPNPFLFDSYEDLEGADTESESFESELDERMKRIDFLRKFTGNSFICYHLLSDEIVPLITIDEIIFDRRFRYAVMSYSCCMHGETVVLRKKGKEWIYDHFYEFWVE